MKRTRIIIVLLLTVATVHGTQPFAGAQATSVGGLWSGTTLVTECDFSTGRCNAQNKITLNLTQQNNRVTGNYTCAYGTMICRHGGADNTATIISGRIAGSQIRLSLMFPADGSNCYYFGLLTSATDMHGTYMCYNGGADLLEEGTWDVTHASNQ